MIGGLAGERLGVAKESGWVPVRQDRLARIVERQTNLAMGTEIDRMNEFEDILCLDPALKAGNGFVPAKEAMAK